MNVKTPVKSHSLQSGWKYLIGIAFLIIIIVCISVYFILRKIRSGSPTFPPLDSESEEQQTITSLTPSLSYSPTVSELPSFTPSPTPSIIPSPTPSLTPSPTPSPSASSVILNLQPYIYLSIDSLSNNAVESQLQNWMTYNNMIATATKVGSANFPMVKSENNQKYVRLGTGTTPNATDGNFFSFGNLTFNSATNGGFTFICVVRFYLPDVINFQRVFDFGNGSPNNNIIFSRFGTERYFCSNYFAGTTRGRIPFPNNQIRNTTQWDVIGLRIKNNAHYISSLTTGAKEYTPNTLETPTPNPNETFQTLTNRTLSNNFIGKSNWTGDPYYPLDLREFVIYDKEISINDIENIRQKLIAKYNIV